MIPNKIIISGYKTANHTDLGFIVKENEDKFSV
jgi:hypothetical protein